MDDAETLKKFKESLKAPFAFVADPDGKVVKAYDVKTPVLSFAQRYTFVIGEDTEDPQGGQWQRCHRSRGSGGGVPAA